LSWISRWTRLLRPLLRGATVERELDEELRLHIELETEDLIRQGWSPGEARREAHRRFGGVERFKQQVREGRRTRPLEELWQDARLALRGLVRRPAFAATVLVTLSLGIGANTAVFTAVKAVFLESLPFPEAQRLFVLRERSSTGELEEVSALNLRDFRDGSTTPHRFAGWTTEIFNWTGAGEPEPLTVVRASVSLFDVLEVLPALGRPFLPEDAPATEGRVAVLSHGFWRSHLGADSAALGRSLTLDGEPYTIVGVMPPGFRFPDDPGVALWIPHYLRPYEARSRRVRNLEVLVRLAPGATHARASAEMQDVAQRLGAEHPASNGGWGAELMPAHEVLVRSSPVLLVLSGAVGFLLLIACVNVTNLLLTHFSERERELALRSALGAGIGRLARQFMAESLVFAALGGVGGAMLGALLLAVLRGLDPGYLPGWNPLQLDGMVLAFTALIAMVTAVLAGVLPGLHVVRARLRDGLATAFRGAIGAPRAQTVRNSLAVSEVALAVVLLSASGLLIESLRRVLAEDAGLAAESVVAGRLELPGRYAEATWAETFHLIQNEVSRIPGVVSTGLVTTLPLMPAGTDYDIDVFVAGTGASVAADPASADLRVATPGYFRTLGIPLQAGRPFDASDREDGEPVAIINGTFARRHFAGGDPLGQLVRLFARESTGYRIVGVVGDVRHRGLDHEPRPEIFVPYRQLAHDDMVLAVRTAGDPLRSIDAIKQAIYRIDADLPLSHVSTVSALISDSVADRRFQAVLLSILAGLGLLLAIVGIYGVVGHGVRARTREIGLRVAVGATRVRVLAMILERGLRLAVAGLALGLAGALALTRLLAGLLYGVTPTDPITLGIVAVSMVVMSVLASVVPAWRAARLDPMSALRID